LDWARVADERVTLLGVVEIVDSAAETRARHKADPRLLAISTAIHGGPIAPS
jgi:hypothetical protein